MSLILTAFISLIGIITGKIFFKKWTNHLSFYCLIMGGLVFLYELKFLPYPDITPLAWFLLISAFVSFLLGVISILTARNLYNKNNFYVKDSILTLKIFTDNGKILKYSIIFFGTITLLAAIQNWLVLINKYGGLTEVFLNASKIYRLFVRGEIKGFIPYISAIGYVAIFFSGIYTAYRGRFSFLSFFPFIGIIIRELAITGRAGILFAFVEFLIAFFLFRHLLKTDLSEKFKFSKKNAIISFSFLLIILIVSASFARLIRLSDETYSGASRELRQLEDNPIFSPSVYLYLSSDIGVLIKYLESDGEDVLFGENTFLPIYGFLAKFGFNERPKDFQEGYYIPLWTNTGTYIRELHADFGFTGVFIGSYLLGLLITWLWFAFYEHKKLIVFALLVYLNLIISFSFLVMVTRLVYWFTSLFIILISIPIMEKFASREIKDNKVE